MLDISPSTYLLSFVYTKAMACFILPPSLSLSNKPPTLTIEVRCMFGEIHSQKEQYNASFVLGTPASPIFKITVQEAISESTEWNSTAISKPSHPKVYIYISETATV